VLQVISYQQQDICKAELNLRSLKVMHSHLWLLEVTEESLLSGHFSVTSRSHKWVTLSTLLRCSSSHFKSCVCSCATTTSSHIVSITLLSLFLLPISLSDYQISQLLWSLTSLDLTPVSYTCIISHLPYKGAVIVDLTWLVVLCIFIITQLL